MCPKFSIGFLRDFPTNSLRLTATIIPSWLKIWTQWIDEDEYEMKNYVEPIGWFFLSQIHPEVVVFDRLVGIKCVRYCELFPYHQMSASSPFRELTRDFSGQKLTKWVRIVVVFFLWKSTSRLRLRILCNASRSEGTSLWVNVWRNE